MDRAGAGGRGCVPVVSGVSALSSGDGKQSRRHNRAGWRARLAHQAAAAGSGNARSSKVDLRKAGMYSSQIPSVLYRIDADFDNSLDRLFALLRIKSISADPAFAGDCKAAADHLAKDIAKLGFHDAV